MAKSWDYGDDRKRIIISPPKQTNKISGHRLSTILGLNKYSTPFQAWCEITKLARPEIEDNKYLNAGRILEPKIIEYVSKQFPNVMSIKDYYGKVFKQYEFNNFKDESNIFGGVIDAVATADDKKTIMMICECKTSSHPEQWRNGNVPVEYLLQGALYSYLKGLDRVLFACTFLDEVDYGRPEDVQVSDKNTILVVKKLKDMIFEIDGEYYNIEGCMQLATQWWKDFVESGISPEFDEKADKEYLDLIRATDETKDNDLFSVCEDAIELALKIDELKETSGINALEKRLKLLETSIKNEMINSGATSCGAYKLTKKVTKKFNEEEFANANPDEYESYIEEKESYTLTKSKKKEEE